MMAIPHFSDDSINIGDFRFSSMKASQCGGLVNFCAWRELLLLKLGDRKTCMVPPHSNSIIGTIAHQMLQMVFEDKIRNLDQFDAEWEQRVSNHSTKLLEDYPWLSSQPPINNYERKFRTRVFAMKWWQRRVVGRKRNDFSSTSEQSFEIPGLTGRIDLIYRNESKTTIYDYKTGEITDGEGRVKIQYEVQMKLYGLLFTKATGEKIDRLVVVDLRGQEFEIPFQSDNLEILYQEVISKIEIINQFIERGDMYSIANLSRETCGHCRLRSVCHFYWNSSVKIDSDITGVFREVKQAADQSLILVLDSDSGRRFVRNLNGRSVDDFAGQNGCNLRVINAWPCSHPKLSGHHTATPHTTLIWHYR